MAYEGEQTLRLRRLTARQIGGLLTESGRRYGYSVGETAAGTYRLARVRRKAVVNKVTETVAVAVSEDRAGTLVRFVGVVDQAIISDLEHAEQKLAELRLSRDEGAVNRFEPANDAPSDSAAERAPLPDWRPAGAGPLAEPPAAAAPADVPSAVPAFLQVGASPAADRPPPLAPRVPVPAAGSGRPTLPAPPTPTPGPAVPEEVGEADTISRRGGASAAPTPRRLEGVHLQLADGRVAELNRPIVIGRNPDRLQGPDGCRRLRLDDPLVSKTHAVVQAYDGAVWVMDVHSTNGTAIEDADGRRTCQPDEWEMADEDATIVVGDMRFVVRLAT